VATIGLESHAGAARQQRRHAADHAGMRAVTPAFDAHGILEQLVALALGADPQRMTLMQLYLGLKGRIPRRTYWLHGVLSLLLLGVVVNGLLDIANVDNDTAGKLVNLVFLWPLIAVSVKRQHDFNFSGWWALIHFVPAVGSLLLLAVDGSIPGTRGANRFGIDPREALARARINSAH
jgi:uncharacterized membrane protein YhaH (DUF805 family)